MWWFFCDPFNRFPFLAIISFEKIIVFVSACSIFFSKDKIHRNTPITILLILFFIFCVIGYFLSPYMYFYTAQHWVDNYWKYMVLYFLILYGLRNKNDIIVFITGTGYVCLFYQLLSWKDFILGGSYVYQQGLKRMIGIWSDGGIGAANSWGMFSLICIPIGIYLYQTHKGRTTKYASISLIALSILSVIFSGTRAALVTFIAVYAIIYFKRIAVFKYILLAVMLIMIGYAYLPEEYKQRYSLIIIDKSEEETLSREEKKAVTSAENRIQGLIDGWYLFTKKPFFGYGPGTSAIARLELSTTTIEQGKYLGLHSFYGQILAETGILGTLSFFMIIFNYLNAMRQKNLKLYSTKVIDQDFNVIKNYLYSSIFILLLYGFFAHHLFRNYWIILFALHAVFISENRNRDNVKAY